VVAPTDRRRLRSSTSTPSPTSSGATHFDAFVDAWWPTITHLRPTTLVSYEYLLRVYIRPTFGPVAIGRITPAMVQAWRAQLRASGLAPNSVAKAYRLLARVIAVAVRDGYVGRSPCMERGASIDETPEMRFATADQVDALAAAVPERYRVLVYVAAYSSLRFGELTGLRCCDVNPLHKTVTVAQQITEVGGQLHVGPPKTASSKRTVRLPAVVAVMLDEHLQRHGRAALPARRRRPTGGHRRLPRRRRANVHQ
jgi:integrase